MKFTVFALAAGLLVAGSASASEKVTDVDFLKANRCKGLAAGIGSVDTSGLDAYLKAEGRSRNVVILQRGEEEFDRAKRSARNADLKPRLTAELTGPCLAYMGGGKDVATSR